MYHRGRVTALFSSRCVLVDVNRGDIFAHIDRKGVSRPLAEKEILRHVLLG